LQLIDVGAALLERPLVVPELRPKFAAILDMLEAELDAVEVRDICIFIFILWRAKVSAHRVAE
jgi:hypothetical protein